MALGLTQPLTEMSTRNISWGVGEVKEPQPPGTFMACPGLEWYCFTIVSNQDLNIIKFNRL